MQAVEVADGCLRLGARQVPLLSGEVHFWRMDPRDWNSALASIAREHIPIVATYLSWRRHAPTPDVVDLQGTRDPRLNVRRFVQQCAAHGLLVHLKPGPWICAEEPAGGYPDWLVADRDLLALDAAGRPIAGYGPPFAHPVPSYLHPTYLRHTRSWIRSVDEHLHNLFYPAGPITLIQLDNEPSYCFRDGMYEADYHPVALAQFRRYVLARYGSLSGVEAAWEQAIGSADAIDPPRKGVSQRLLPGSGGWRREQDWVAFRTWLIGEYLRRLHRYHLTAGADRLLFTINYNRHRIPTVPQDPMRLSRIPRVIAGEDLYYQPPLQRRDVAYLAFAAALALAGSGVRWAPEIQSGIWRLPGSGAQSVDPSPTEQAFWYLAALAFGLQGLNFYMLVQRENWQHSPLTAGGRGSAFLPGVRRAVALVRATPGWGTYRPISSVALLWHPSYHRDAYAAERDFDQEHRAAASTRALEAHEELLWAGHVALVWDGASRTTPTVPSIVVPAAEYLDAEIQRRLVQLAQAGREVVLLGPTPQMGKDGEPCTILADALRAHGPGLRRVESAAALAEGLRSRPPLACDSGQGLGILHRGRRGALAFILHWGERPAAIRLEFSDHFACPSLTPIAGVTSGKPVPIRDGSGQVRAKPWSVGVYRLDRTRSRRSDG